MARAPRASVSKTSGQGISRLSYQKGRKLSGTGSKTSTGISSDFDKPSLGGEERRYAKSGSKGDTPQGMNISYGDTIFPSDLEDVKALGEGPAPKKSDFGKQQGAKKWKTK